MYLKALEIQGFKSFPDKTVITINKGITAVVGPNGSGKSNISDAIRWVMGETSARQLRGGGKMENVIFGGTQQRSAMGYASVRLYVDNSDRRIDVEADEVVIGRRYYRSGESEYTINGQNVRLKDIYEMFLDTGLGRDGYSIIGQGRIAEIVGAKSAERREIFEEASGIAKFRYRKNEAERRLASAEDNLVRLRDILNELAERVGPLEKESEKAQRFLELAGRKKSLEVTLWVDTVHRARDTVREQQRKIELAQADYDRLSGEIEREDAAAQALRDEMETLNREIERCNTEIRAITESISGADAKLAVLQNDVEHNEAAEASLRSELEQGSLGRRAIDEQKDAAKKAAEAGEAALAELDARAAALEEKLAELQRASAESGERRGAVQAQLAQLAARATELKVASAASASAVQAQRQRLADARSQLAENAEAKRRTDADLADTEALLKDVREKRARLENIRAGLALKLDSRRAAFEQADAEEQKLARDMEAAAQRLSLLRDLERNLDGFQHSVKTVMKAAQAHRLRGVIGPVSTVLSVKHGYEVAVETALGFALQNIVVEDEGAAKAAMAFLKNERAGRATFLPLDTMRPSHFDASRLPAGAALASSLVRYEARFEPVVSNLLGRIVVVEDINEASRVAKLLDYRNRVVTRDGQVVNAGGSFTGGSVSRSAGLFSRKQEMDDLRAKLAALEEKRPAAEERTEAAKAELDKLTADMNATQSESITASGDEIRAEAERQRLAGASEQLAAAAAQLAAECEQLEQAAEKDEAAGRQADEDLACAQRQTQALEAELAQLSGSDGEFLASRTQLSEELSGVKLERLGAQRDIEAARAQLAQLEGRTDESEARARQILANIEALHRQNEAARAEMEQVRGAIADSRGEIAKREQAIADTARRRMEKDGEASRCGQRARALGDEREALSREAARLAEQKQAKDAEYEQTAAKLWEEYELSLADAEALCVAFDTVTELRRQVGEVRGKIRALGNVNVGAIEEYAEVKQRYDFLGAQVRDVEGSKAQLLRLIGGLSDEMRAMFTESFAQINRHFGRIFGQLFGGGSARLYLEDEADVLGSGIGIEVQPPGKIIRDLASLSGGEQALVAISIYFAILAVNPAPFCVLDEIEAALDDVNVVRYAQYLRHICDKTQFILITHRRGTMEEADVLYGVTMQEDGVSKVLKLDLDNVDASMVS